MSVSIVSSMSPAEPGAFLAPPQLLRLVRRRAGLIAGCAFGGALVGFVAAHLMTPYFTATAILSVDNSRFLIPELQGASGAGNAPIDPQPAVHTEAAAIAAPQLVYGVIDKLQLRKMPEFNPPLRPKSIVGKIIAPVHDLLGSLRNKSDSPNASNELVYDTVLQDLSVLPDSKSTTIEVAFASHQPQLSADFVNLLVRLYIELLDAQRRTVDQSANGALNQQLQQVSGEIKGLQQQLQDLRAKTNYVGLRAGSVGQQQMEDLATAADEASVQRARAEAAWQRARAIMQQGHPDALASVLDSPTISQLRQQEFERRTARGRPVAALRVRISRGALGAC